VIYTALGEIKIILDFLEFYSIKYN